MLKARYQRKTCDCDNGMRYVMLSQVNGDNITNNELSYHKKQY